MVAAIYPNGFDRGLIARGVPILQTQPGQVFWVYNGSIVDVSQSVGSDDNRGSFDLPFATIDYAIGQCTSGRGDIIFVKPGHAETLSVAAAITADRANVAIVGLGAGAARPTLTFDTTAAATIAINSPGVAFKNFVLLANFADIVAPFTLTTAADFTLEACEIRSVAANMNFLNIVDTDTATGNANGLTLLSNLWVEPDLATLQMVKMDGSNERVTISDNLVNIGAQNNTPALMAIAAGKVISDLDCARNLVYRLNTDSATGALLITTNQTTNTGWVRNNLVQHADTAAEVLVTASAGFGLFENRASGVAGASGYLLPSADS